jgi:glycosyltransferase involved in cell wall biosynthesis
VRTDYFTPGDEDGDFFLVVSRLVGYKRIDLAIEAFNDLGLPLVVIGDGPERKKLEDAAKDNIKFLGRQPDDVVRDHMRKCKALIFPGEEDFGITPVEVQACGRSVIAYGKGGATETILDGASGVLFYEQDSQLLASTVKKFHTSFYNSHKFQTNADQFSIDAFSHRVNALLIRHSNILCNSRGIK